MLLIGPSLRTVSAALSARAGAGGRFLPGAVFVGALLGVRGRLARARDGEAAVEEG